MKKILSVLISLIILMSFTGCGDKETKETIAVSIDPIKCFVQNIVGDNFDVQVAVPTGQSPETYQPSIRDMTGLYDSKVYFSVGLNNEKVNIIPKLNSETNVVYLNTELVNKGFQTRYLGDEEDPHIWLSVLRAKGICEIICEKLCELYPDSATIFTQNKDSYVEKLDKLYNDVNTIFSSLDSNKKNVIVYHPSFGYLLDEFGFNMYALEKDGKEPTLIELADMADFARENSIKAVFYQAETDSSDAIVFANEIGGKAYMLDPLSINYIDNILYMANSIVEAQNS